MGAVVLENKPLPANGSYTQNMQDRFGYNDPVGAVSGEVYSDKAGTIYLEESDDAGTSWTQTATITVNAGVTTSLPWTKLTKRWFRFRYVNGAVAQGSFILVQQVEGMGFALPSSSGALTTQLTGSNALGAVAVTPSDDTDLAGGATKGLYLGGAGNMVVIMSDDTEVTFTALSAGMIHPISVKRVKATNTTATSILAVY